MGKSTSSRKDRHLAKTSLLAARIVIVYLLVSLIIRPLNFFAVSESIKTWSFYNVFTNLSLFKSKMLADGLGNWANGVYAAAIVAYVAIIVLVIAGLVSIFDGRVKRVGVIAMLISYLGFLTSAGIVFYITQHNESVWLLPNIYISAAVGIVGVVACFMALFIPDGKMLYAKEVDPSTLGGKLTNYFAASAAEVKKIVWPTPKQVINNTIVVIICILCVGTVIWAFDALLVWLIKLLLG